MYPTCTTQHCFILLHLSFNRLRLRGPVSSFAFAELLSLVLSGRFLPRLPPFPFLCEALCARLQSLVLPGLHLPRLPPFRVLESLAEVEDHRSVLLGELIVRSDINSSASSFTSVEPLPFLPEAPRVPLPEPRFARQVSAGAGPQVLEAPAVARRSAALRPRPCSTGRRPRRSPA